MSTSLMILPAGDSNSIRLVRLPEDFEEHEAYRHVTALIAAIEEQQPDCSSDDILASLEDHFGETVEVDSEAKRVITEYLNANAAERSSAKTAAKIMKCLGSETPMRITQIPYIQKKHHEISPDVVKREAIGSLSNCSACHTTAEKGIYDDDDG